MQTDLSTRQSLTPTQALQIWKGLFYLLYLTPQHPPLPHQRLIATVASLASTDSTPSPDALVPLVTAFWETMAREWESIDGLRMDKYLLLIRLLIRGMMSDIVTAGNGGDGGEGVDDLADLGSKLITVLETWPLALPSQGSKNSTASAESNFTKVAEGLRYHVLDCWVDEIEVAVRSSSDNSAAMADNDDDDDNYEGDQIDKQGSQSTFGVEKGVVESLLKPVKAMSESRAIGVSKGIRKRAKETAEDERWVRWMHNS